ncbi:hypothetical protein FQN54_009088 [Arachnomyces sp. PD_36]|nr:hypothetical protein FQN54_009088 [Arachnomyces sp. PD_36]
MASNDNVPPKLTFLEKLDLIPAFLSVIGTALYSTIFGPFRGENGARKYTSHITHSVARQVTTRLSQRQTHALNPTTPQSYKNFARRKGVKPDTVTLEHGGLGHWVGNKDAKAVLIYYHGGGFELSADAAYFEYLSDLIDELNASGKDIAVFFLTYTRTPNAVYPVQLRQSVAALSYIINDTGRKPSQIFIGGDSAGGNLSLAILSHLSHPHKDIKPLPLPEPLAGAILIAPWVSFDTTWPTLRSNGNKDIISVKSTSRWGVSYLGGQKADNYSEPFLAPPEWWKGVQAKDILILAGSDEIFFSSIEEFVKKFKASVPQTTYFVGEYECHVGMILERLLGDRTETQQGKEMRSWLSARL